VNECKPLMGGHRTRVGTLARSSSGILSSGRGLHSSTSQLNLSRVWQKKIPYTP